MEVDLAQKGEQIPCTFGPSGVAGGAVDVGMGTSVHAMADRTPMTMEQLAQQLQAAPDNGFGHCGGKKKKIEEPLYTARLD